MYCTTITAAALFGMLVAQHAWAGSFKRFDLAGQTAICGTGIADNGTVAGNTLPAIANPAPVVNFTYKAGQFATVMPTTGGTPQLTGINRAGLITGEAFVSTSNPFNIVLEGFTVQGGVTTLLSLPGAVASGVTDVNDAGTIVGFYETSGAGPLLGFIKRGSKLVTFTQGSGDTEPAGIDATGTRIVGLTLNGTTYTSWLRDKQVFTPIAVPGAFLTAARGVNSADTISGTYLTGSSSSYVSHGFLYQGGVYTTVDAPGAVGTMLGGINSRGEVAGCYSDAAGTHGLIYTP